ncbi:MAG: hypothetical protein GY797_03320 [Deltaproteobacteria bacterium]|nr:hypothetical protein [Deltaproteobacteria bacterium]
MCNSDEKKQVYDRWTHEDNLINHRLTWLLTSQTIFFSGYGLILRYGLIKENIAGNQLDIVLKLIPYLGISTGLLVFFAILAAVKILHKLKKTNKFNGKSNGQQSKNLNYNHYEISNFSFFGGLVPPLIIPTLFVGSWIFLIIT